MRNFKYVLLVVSSAVSILISYLYIDRTLAQMCLHDSTWHSASFFTMIKQLGVSTPYLIGSALLYLFFNFIYKNKFYANHALLIFSAVAFSGIVTDIIKVLLGRFRPTMLFEHELYGFDFFHIESLMTSFPSGHTSTAFALAMYIAHYWPKYSILGWILAIAVGMSRVVQTFHYLSDVLAGGLVGVIAVKIVIMYWPDRLKPSKI